jgi:hypothetical protein
MYRIGFIIAEIPSQLIGSYMSPALHIPFD